MDVIRLRMPDLKRAAGVSTTDTSDNWNIFDSISGPYKAATEHASRFRAILNRARERLGGTMAVDRVTSDDVAKDHRDALVDALVNLTTFSVQGHVVDHVVDVVASFLKDPRLFRTRLLNFILMGGAGTGKTTLAEAIGDVFAKAGCSWGTPSCRRDAASSSDSTWARRSRRRATSSSATSTTASSSSTRRTESRRGRTASPSRTGRRRRPRWWNS